MVGELKWSMLGAPQAAADGVMRNSLACVLCRTDVRGYMFKIY